MSMRRWWRDELPSQSVLDQLRVGVAVLDRADRVVTVNPAARGMGLVRPNERGDELASALVRTAVGQVRRSGDCRVVTLDLPPGANHRPGLVGIDVRITALAGGHVMVEATDVTEAHRLDKVRRDFVANVSHELKTPIGALTLLSEALVAATEPSTPDLVAMRRFAERIRHESTRLGRLVGDLLELTRLQGAEPLPTLAPVSVDAIIAEVVDRSRTQATVKGIELDITGTRGLVVYGNESQLVTGVANLVDNAVAYSPECSRIGLAVGTSQGWVEIVVTDQGIGIAADDLDRIFERFYRADAARSRATGGTGLGLAIVKHVATNHGGGVDVVSTPGVGSTFTLRLPQRSPGATSAPPGGGSV
jgi:two-component system sensor histidine kinase SenX3